MSDVTICTFVALFLLSFTVGQAQIENYCTHSNEVLQHYTSLLIEKLSGFMS